jgi:hypothetical protein
MDELQPDHILQVGLGFWAPKTLLSAVEMEVFTELAKHLEDLETFAGTARASPPVGTRFLGCSRSPEIPRTTRWSVLQHTRHGFFSRQKQGIWTKPLVFAADAVSYGI